MTETYETLLPFVSVAVAVLGLVYTYFRFVIKIREDIGSMKTTLEDHTKHIECLPQMRGELAKLTAADEVFWRVLGPSLGEIIHSPIHKRRDRLMDEWLAAPKNSIPESDLRNLRDELEQMLEEADAGNDVGVRLIGALLLARVEAQISTIERQPFINGGV